MKANTENLIKLAVALHRADPSAKEYVANLTRSSIGLAGNGDRDWEGRLAASSFATEFAFNEWRLGGFPLVVFDSMDDALALAETEPPTWEYVNPYGVLGMEVGVGFALVKAQWNVEPDGDTPDPVVAHWDAVRQSMVMYLGGESGVCCFSVEQLDRLAVNVLLTLLERPDGISVAERRPSAKAARKRGRRYYPNVEYIIGSSMPLWKPHQQADAGAVEGAPRETPADGWTLSVRTMVRGHWRRQACGPQMAERRVTWIRPHWKGPEDAPLSAHATRIATPRR